MRSRENTVDSGPAAGNRSPRTLINEITSDAELRAYQDDLVRQGLEDMQKGRVIPHEEVVKRFFSK